MKADRIPLIDSGHGYTGRASEWIVFTAIESATVDDAAARRIFVDLTRAAMKLSLVVAEKAARALLDQLSNA